MKRYFLIVLIALLSLLPPARNEACSRCGGTVLRALPRAFAAESFVCITKKGKKYHRAQCRVLKDAELEKLTRTEAENRGYSPCKICRP